MIIKLNRAYITLIPKIDYSGSVCRYRPISLSNASYKIMSKFLANKLKKVIPKLISPLQGTFSQGGGIHDSILWHT